MSKLFYRYGAMNSGKSTALLQVAHNYEERGQLVIVTKPATDLKAERAISSRLGFSRETNFLIGENDDLFSLFTDFVMDAKVACLLIDEAQFLSRQQVDNAFGIAVKLGVPVLAYGIRTDFLGDAFPGSARLLEIAHSLEELKTICRCGSKAMFNARSFEGEYVSIGETVEIDGGDYVYESMCGKCYLSFVNDFTVS